MANINVISSVDVVVPCYRYAHYLRQCVESILSHSGLNIRVLIIDDASPDNTREVAIGLMNKDSRVKLLSHSINKGHISTYNEGINWASADYMLLLSADDYLLPGALNRAVNLMNEQPEVGFTFGEAISLEACGTIRQTKLLEGITEKLDWRILDGLEFIELISFRNIVRTPTAVVRTVLQKSLGGYRSELPHSGDMEMWLRFAAHASVGILSADQAVYRLHNENMSLSYMAQSGLLDIKHRKAAFDYFFQSFGNTLPDAQRLQRKLFQLLGIDAIGLAGMAFNNGEMEVTEQLSALAIDFYPQVTATLQWKKLSCKRLFGFKAWCVLKPIIKKLNQ